MSVSDLEHLLAASESMWAHWRDLGVDEHTVLTVDFQFYSASVNRGAEMAEVLRTKGMAVTTAETRTMLVFKGLKVTASEGERWSLETLQQRIREMHAIARRYEVSLEGLGAAMPQARAG